MSKMRDNRRWVFTCNQCFGKYRSISTLLMSAWNEAQRKGWRFVDARPAPLHFCCTLCRDIHDAAARELATHGGVQGLGVTRT